jgi:hypothetical protein
MFTCLHRDARAPLLQDWYLQASTPVVEDINAMVVTLYNALIDFSRVSAEIWLHCWPVPEAFHPLVLRFCRYQMSSPRTTRQGLWQQITSYLDLVISICSL